MLCSMLYKDDGKQRDFTVNIRDDDLAIKFKMWLRQEAKSQGTAVSRVFGDFLKRHEDEFE